MSEGVSMKVKDFVKGEGPEVSTGYNRGDSWVQTVGPHVECEHKIIVLGEGIGLDAKGRLGPGVLVRCFGCLFSWVIR